MILSPVVQTAILEDLARPSSDIAKVSRQYGVPIRIIRELLDERLPTSAVFKEENGGQGRLEMQPYILSRTPAGRAWPVEDREKIEAARVEYDEGLVEIATGRDGNWLILYRIPRKEKDRNRRIYFARVFL